MADVVPESPSYIYHLTTALGLLALIALYSFGTWSRSYLLPVPDQTPLKKQIIGSVPVGCITMGLYAKSAFPTLSVSSSSLVLDCSIMSGYAVVLGMLSRETLERLLAAVQAARQGN